MTFPDYVQYESVRSRGDRGPGVKQAFNEDGGGGGGGGTTAARRAVAAAWAALGRRKAAGEGAARLSRVLSALDLTALGVGSTLGVGVYVLAGDVAKNYAGPAVVLSFLIAAVASMLAGLCYAEFGARVPKAGSAYVYSYVCVGEFIAFIIGWNLILEYVIGAASVTKALSEYVDALWGGGAGRWLARTLPLSSPHLAPHPDLLAFTLIMLFSAGLAFGVKESTRLNNLCTGINLAVVIFVVVSGCFKVDPENWRVTAAEAREAGRAAGRDYGGGGFAPYGLAGVVRGAAVCFYGFIGFDCVATAGEEARNPQKSIPLAVVSSLLVVFLSYCGVSVVLTLMLPYYLQDEKAPFPFVYSVLGWEWARYLVSVGAICALCSSLLGAVFPLPRIIYAMSVDGLLFRALGRVSDKYQTPVLGTLTAGLFTGVLAMLFELKQLIHMMSIGTLLAYSMVAACVLMLRYSDGAVAGGAGGAGGAGDAVTARAVWLQLTRGAGAGGPGGAGGPTPLSAALVSVLVTLYGAWSVCLVYCVHHYGVLPPAPAQRCLLSLSAALALLTLLAIQRQPRSDRKLAFAVPLVPWLPAASVLVNVYLMMNLDLHTWLRFAVWIALGLVIYATYGVWHSAERVRGPVVPTVPAAGGDVLLLPPPPGEEPVSSPLLRGDALL